MQARRRSLWATLRMLCEGRTPLADFFSILLSDDVAHKIVQCRIGDLDLDEFPCCG